MRQTMCVMLSISIFCSSMLIAGCAGRTANPVAAYLPGDESRSCQAIKTEYTDNEAQITKLKSEKSGTTVWNVACFVGGFFIIVPWFLMDLKDAPKIEMEALKKRNSNLKVMASERNCDLLSTTTSTE